MGAGSALGTGRMSTFRMTACASATLPVSLLLRGANPQFIIFTGCYAMLSRCYASGYASGQ